MRAVSADRAAASAAEPPTHAAIPPPSTKPATAAPMRTFFWFARSWPRQSVTTATSLPQLLDGHAELGPVGLDRAADLLGGARRPSGRLSGTAVPGCWGWEPETVSRINCASSMAMTGVGGIAFLIERNASRPPIAPSRNRISVVIRKPSHGPLPVPRISQMPHDTACSR